jgi:hypothetical protein
MSEPLLSVHNFHFADCGDPPIITSDDPKLYIGYFENSYGEQWVFTCNRGSGEAHLRGGDLGWNEIHPVQDGKVDGVVLSRPEQKWLKACWEAVSWVRS